MTAVAIGFTWPLALHPGSMVYGTLPSDLSSSIGQFQTMADHNYDPFLPGRIREFSAPDGLPIPWALNVASLPSTLSLALLARVFGAIAATALFTIAGFVGSAFSLFLLVRWLGGRFIIAASVGVAFAFWTLPASYGINPQFIHTWVFVLLLWRVLVTLERPTLRNGLLAGAAGVLAAWWTPYFILIGGVMYTTLFAVAIVLAVVRGGWRRQLVAQGLGYGVFVSFLLLLLALYKLSAQGSGIFPTQLWEVATYAGKPLEYVIPGPSSVLWGGLTGRYVVDHLYQSVYLGGVALLTACAGVVYLLRRRYGRRQSNAAVLVFFVAVTAFLVGLPPQYTVLGHEVRMPSYFVHAIVPTWRIYLRFGFVLMLAVLVLAALATVPLLAARPRLRLVVLVAVALLIPLDAWGRPAHPTAVLGVPTVYRLLRSMPEGIVAMYPLQPAVFTSDDAYLYQHYDGKPSFGGYDEGSVEEARALRLARLSDPATPGRLRAAGVRYVVLPKIAKTDPAELGPAFALVLPGLPTGGVRLVAEDPRFWVYRIVARPVPFLVPISGFLGDASGRPSIDDFVDHVWWMTGQEGTLELDSGCLSCTVSGSVTLVSYYTTRTVVVRVAGRTVATAVVGTRPIRVHFAASVSNRTQLSIVSEEGPSSAVATAPERESAVQLGLEQRGAASASVEVVGEALSIDTRPAR